MICEMCKKEANNLTKLNHKWLCQECLVLDDCGCEDFVPCALHDVQDEDGY